MNERILELVALVLEAEPEHRSYGRIEFGINLAELIVKECADIATNRYQRLMDGGKAIKEYFGVEE